jgi:hypothetical protein
MKKFALVAFAAAAALGLAGCGKSDDASDQATADNVEMPADELPAAAPSAETLPPAPVAPAADASQAALSAEDAARSARDNAISVAEAAKAAAAEAEDQQPKSTQP